MSLTESHEHLTRDGRERKGFFTDTSICIGCKACEVACKEWNHIPTDSDWELRDSSYDNTGELGADTWRHVAFIEQGSEQIERARESGRRLVSLGMPTIGPPQARAAADGEAALSGIATRPPATPDFRGLPSGRRPGIPRSRSGCRQPTTRASGRRGCPGEWCPRPTGALFRTEFGTVV